MKFNQLSLFDNQKYLEPKHFDSAQTNPNFIYYLHAVGKKVGDPYRLYNAQQWINGQVEEFKHSHGLKTDDMLNKIDSWPEKLREYLKGVAENDPNHHQCKK